jgi:hypothetical protein
MAPAFTGYNYQQKYHNHTIKRYNGNPTRLTRIHVRLTFRQASAWHSKTIKAAMVAALKTGGPMNTRRALIATVILGLSSGLAQAADSVVSKPGTTSHQESKKEEKVAPTTATPTDKSTAPIATPAKQ